MRDSSRDREAFRVSRGIRVEFFIRFCFRGYGVRREEVEESGGKRE